MTPDQPRPFNFTLEAADGDKDSNPAPNEYFIRPENRKHQGEARGPKKIGFKVLCPVMEENNHESTVTSMKKQTELVQYLNEKIAKGITTKSLKKARSFNT